MKILLLSDIHSNPACLQAILDAEPDADAIYCAGDLVDYGPDPSAVIDLVCQHQIHSVCGNHDRRVVRLWTQWDRKMPDTGLRWAQHNICKLEECADLHNTPDAYYQYLKGLPRFLSFTADGIAYLVTHQYGDGYETIESAWHFNRFWNEHFDMPGCEGMPRRMIFGHTHRQMQVTFADTAGRAQLLWLNPGSASYRRPDESSKDAFYATITDGHIDMKHLSYDRSSIYEQVLAVKDSLDPDELRVAEFFFGWTESDGPDYAWIEYIRNK